MKKNMSRTISLALVIVMMTTLLAACGGSASSTASSGKETESKMELTWYNINPPYENDTWGEQTFEELFDVDVKIVRAETEDELSTLLASGEIPDVIFTNSIEEVGKYQKLGILATITEEEIKQYMPKYYAMAIAEDPHFFTYANIGGSSYGITRLKATGGIAQAAVIRADWLEACGITEVPRTLEELETAFDAFVNNDPDGNGLKDTYALTSGADKENGKRFFSTVFGAYGLNPFCWRENNGTVEFGFATDDCKDALKLLNSWYQKGYIDPEFVTDESRTSGTDTAYKFANGITGFVDGFAYDDYQWDNDGHVNAKWCAANPEWQEFFTANDGDAAAMYSKVNVTDFSDEMIAPYYIAIESIKGPAGDASAYYGGNNIGGYICFGVQMQENPEKIQKVMEIIEKESTEEEVIINQYGPEGYIWQWNADKSGREWIENYSDKADYNPQGQIMGNGICLWPMYNANTDLLSVVGGVRMEQRYDKDLATFKTFPVQMDAVKVSLEGAAENPDLTYGFPLEYIVKAIRGDVDIDTTWDSTIETWNNNGGAALTEEANTWYASLNG